MADMLREGFAGRGATLPKLHALHSPSLPAQQKQQEILF